MAVVRFGLYAPLPHIVMPEDGGGGTAPVPGYRDARDAVRAADRVGFDITLVAQRFLGPDLEAWMLSAALAECTERIRVMTAVHPGFWIPQVAAKMGSSLDRISGGRFAVNLVTGWWEEEHRMYGGDMMSGDARYRRAAEFVTVLRRLWSEEEVTCEGEFYSLSEARLLVKPRGALPEVYGAARSEAGLDMVARVCDWWFLPYGSELRRADENVAALRDAVSDIGERAARHGRRMRCAVNAFLVHDEDEAAARRTAEAYERHGQAGGVSRIQANGLGIGLVGSRSRIVERIEELGAMGVEMVLLKFSPMVRGVEDFGEHIAPALATSVRPG